MQRYRDVVLNGRGEPVPNVSVLVLTYPAGALADLFSDDVGTVLANPVPSDPNGAFSFKAANGHYSLVISGTGVTAQTVNDVVLNDAADTLAQLAAGSGSNLVTFMQDGAGAVPTTVQDALRERASVRRFIDTTIDGATSNQAGIVAAVAYAYGKGCELHWPPGTYVSDASIQNFHDVTHSGQGVIKRGATLFYITPVLDSQVNTLEVATTGNDANDGLSSDKPMLTAQRLMSVMQGVNILPKLRQGTWKAHIAAGTYTAAANWSKAAIAANFVEFYGDVDGTGAPTTIFDGASSSANAGLYFDSGPSRLQLTNMKSQNYRGTSVASGFVVANKGIAVAYTKNLWSLNNLWAGINADTIGQLLVEAGTHDGNTNYSLRVRGGVEVSIGYNGSAGANRVTLKNSATGSQVRDASTGHFDWVDIINCPTGVWTTNVSRTTHTGMTFNTVNLAFRVDCNSTFNFDATTTFTNVNQRFTLANGSNDNGDGTGDGLTYDYTNNRWAVGMTQHGGGLFSSTAHAWGSNKTGTASFAYMVQDGVIAQMLWGTKTNNTLMRLDVKTDVPQFRFLVNGAQALYFDASAVWSGRDAVGLLGQASARWLNVYSRNVTLTPPATVTPANNGEMTFEATGDTTLKIKYKGSDGIVRSVSLTLA